MGFKKYLFMLLLSCCSVKNISDTDKILIRQERKEEARLDAKNIFMIVGMTFIIATLQ